MGGAGCLGTSCSYDACSQDGDCASGVPCQCRSSSAKGANTCVTGSGCRTDTDCGDNGFCSPSGASNGSMGWFCHTAVDTCVEDADCVGAGNQSECSFDPAAMRWQCGQSTCSAEP